jgi:hypothetical protein
MQDGKENPVIFLDASILDSEEVHAVLREDIKQNRIQFVFPAGLNQVDLFEECRALTRLDDFDTMYDFTMQCLHGKPVTILIMNDDGSKSELCSFQVTDRYMNLRGVDIIDQFPILVTWLTEFMGAYISKKYPRPGRNQSQQQAAEKNRSDRKKEKAAATS